MGHEAHYPADSHKIEGHGNYQAHHRQDVPDLEAVQDAPPNNIAIPPTLGGISFRYNAGLHIRQEYSTKLTDQSQQSNPPIKTS